MAREVGAAVTRTLPIALVIPVKNEARALPELFLALGHAQEWPCEILFADAGSTDGTQLLLHTWWKANQRAGTRFELIELAGALPGEGRNAAIVRAHAEWVAFIDGGIRPDPDWLNWLFSSAVAAGRDHAFGLCRFDGNAPMPLAVCALTNGVGQKRTVLPASLFHRRVFDRVGPFPEGLRSAEDLLWLRRFEQVCGERHVCAEALVHYTHYPSTMQTIFFKWFAFEKSSVLAGVGRFGRVTYLFATLGLLATLLLAPIFAGGLLLLYVVGRGMADPIRRSRAVLWWRAHPAALLWAPVCAAAMDFGRLAGALIGLLLRYRPGRLPHHPR